MIQVRIDRDTLASYGCTSKKDFISRLDADILESDSFDLEELMARPETFLAERTVRYDLTGMEL